jgi:ankyrin repeat protein
MSSFDSLKRLLGFTESPRQQLMGRLTALDFDRAFASIATHPELKTQRAKDGRTVLSECAAHGLTPAVKWLLENQFAVDLRDADGASPLHSATILMAADICTLLLDAGADVNALDAEGQTPLHWAAEIGATAVCRILLDRGALVNFKNHHRETALDLIDATLDDGTCRTLLEEHGAKPGQ